MPLEVHSGDLLLMFFVWRNTPAVTTPPGWTNLAEQDRAPASSVIFYKSADGTEGGTTVDVVTSVAKPAAAHVYRIKDWASIEVSTGNSAENATPAPNSLTPSWSAKDTLWISSAHAADDDATFTGYLDRYSDGAYTVSGGGVNSGCSLATCRLGNNVTTENPSGTFTLSESEAWVSWLVAIEPLPNPLRGRALFLPPKAVRAPELLVGRKPTGPVEVDWQHSKANGLRVAVVNSQILTGAAETNDPIRRAGGRWSVEQEHGASTASPLWAGKDIRGLIRIYVDTLTVNTWAVRLNYGFTSNSDTGGFAIQVTSAGAVRFITRNDAGVPFTTVTGVTLSLGKSYVLDFNSDADGETDVAVYDADDPSFPLLGSASYSYPGRRDNYLGLTNYGSFRSLAEWFYLWDKGINKTQGDTMGEYWARDLYQNPYSILKPMGT